MHLLLHVLLLLACLRIRRWLWFRDALLGLVLRYNVVGVDIRYHGKSSSTVPFTFGNRECLDVIAAIQHIQTKYL